MKLVELAKLWKENKISQEEAIKEFNQINVFNVVEEDGEIYYTNGNGNSWLEVSSLAKLNRQEIIEFRKFIGANKQ